MVFKPFIEIPFQIAEMFMGLLSGNMQAEPPSGGTRPPSTPTKGTGTGGFGGTPKPPVTVVPIHTVQGPGHLPKTAQQRTPTKAPMVAPPKPHRKPHSKLV